MKVRIKTINKEPLCYETPWACWFDFKTIEDVTIEPGESKMIETGTVVEIPKWYMLQIQARSSTFKKYWIMLVNGVWLIDNDYCWDEDTIKFAYINMRKEPVTIEAWTRIWQWVFINIGIAEFEVVDSMNKENRWSFGTTGTK